MRLPASVKSASNKTGNTVFARVLERWTLFLELLQECVVKPFEQSQVFGDDLCILPKGHHDIAPVWCN